MEFEAANSGSEPGMLSAGKGGCRRASEDPPLPPPPTPSPLQVDPKEMQQKAILYRLASWPNLTQLTFMYSIPFGGLAWLQTCQAEWPMQATPMYHYGIASAMGYAMSMFSETLRDRKLVTLETDLLILVIGFCFPMVSVVIDGLTYGSAVTISPPQYWALLGGPHLAAAAESAAAVASIAG